ncbi:transposable element Tc1 transposase [Caerostris extrusa]|uniref:Transposable element Tc1 transposase n=1 Tax=Caerostris extrusa TaxID=172846 RepID=A0AAV4VP51_CAEEX|nr:transposable element Tc1 transposase [Caerostris extrusa]
MKRERLLWARKYHFWTLQDWNKIVFCEEIHFLFKGFEQHLSDETRGEHITEQHLNQTVKHLQKQMFWGYFTPGGPGSLVPVEGMTDSQKYTSILPDKFEPFMQTFDGCIDVIQQDLVPCHTSTLTTKFLKTKLTVLDWPGNSPDINPIENLWSILKRRACKMDCSTKIKMIENVVKVWFRDEDIKNACSKLVESMPKRAKKDEGIFTTRKL